MAISSIRSQVHEAFDFVALSLSCTLEMLLVETRARGIPDNDVAYVLACDERAAATGRGSDSHFQCFRTTSGRIYISRDTGPDNFLATSFEAFAELGRQGDREHEG